MYLKKNKVNSLLKHSLVLFLLLGLASCSIEKRIAKDFVKTPDKGSVLLFTPDFMFKSSLKIDSVENALQYSEEQIDSILYAQSIFLKEVSDSILLSRMVNNYIAAMEAYGFDVYTQEHIDRFMQRDDSLYTVNMAQVELEEYVYEYRDEEYLNGNTYYTDVDLNAVNLNAWFEINMVNSKTKEKNKVLFTSHFLSDDLYGQFTQSFATGEVKYDYRIDSMNVQDIYELASYLGKVYANYTLDYIMNKLIRRNIDMSEYKPDYLHYDPRRNTLNPLYNEENRFIEMDE